MQRRRILHVVAYVPLVILAISAIVTMTQIGCSSGSGSGYGGNYGLGYGNQSPFPP